MVRFLRFLMVCAGVCGAADFADRLYKEGQKAERAGDMLHAYLLYARAAALDPKSVEFAAHKTALRGIAALSARQELDPDPAEPAPSEIAMPELSAADVLEARQALAPPHLTGSQEKKSFDLKGDPRTVFEKVAEAYGVLVVFESDYQAPPPFTFRMTDAGFEEALRALETVGNSFFIPVNDRLALVVRDTPQKRTERAPTMAIGIPIPERMSVVDAQELLTAVQQTLDIRRMTVDPTRHMIFVRDQVTKVEAARLMFYTLSQLRPQVAVDVELLSVDKNSSLNYGMNLPNQISIVNFQGLVSLPTAFRTLERLTGASTPFALGITQASAFATLARSRSDNLLQAEIVSLDGQAATLHVGTRYPVITNGYYGNATGTGQVFAPPPTVNFEDLGLVLKITPSIHAEGEVTLDVETEFKVLGAPSAISGIPIVANRKFTGKVRLKDGEWAVLAGLVQLNDSETRVGWPGLSQLPWIGRFFSQNTTEHDTSQILVVLKPHLTTLPQWERVARAIWIGTETRPITVF